MCVKYRFNKEFYFYFFNFITRFRENIESKIFKHVEKKRKTITIVEIFLSGKKNPTININNSLSNYLLYYLYQVKHIFNLNVLFRLLFYILLIMREKQCLDSV